eukprot:UN03980
MVHSMNVTVANKGQNRIVEYKFFEAIDSFLVLLQSLPSEVYVDTDEVKHRTDIHLFNHSHIEKPSFQASPSLVQIIIPPTETQFYLPIHTRT